MRKPFYRPWMGLIPLLFAFAATIARFVFGSKDAQTALLVAFAITLPLLFIGIRRGDLPWKTEKKHEN